MNVLWPRAKCCGLYLDVLKKPNVLIVGVLDHRDVILINALVH